MGTKRIRRQEPPADDLTEIHRIGEKSQRALNEVGIFTRADLVNADRATVQAVLQSTQHLSLTAIDEILAEAGSPVGQPQDEPTLTTGSSDLASVHVFHLEVTVDAGRVVSTRINHVVSGRPSTWSGLDPTNLQEFVAAAIGLQPEGFSSGGLSTSQMRFLVPTELEGHEVLSVFGVVRASQDVALTDADATLGVALRAIGPPPTSVGLGDRMEVAVFARDRGRALSPMQIGSCALRVADVLEGRGSIVCELAERGSYEITALVEAFGYRPSASYEPRQDLSWLTVDIAAGSHESAARPARLQQLQRRVRTTRSTPGVPTGPRSE